MKTNIPTFATAVLAGVLSLAVQAGAAEIGAEAQKLLGIETAEPAVKSLPPEVAAYGSVLSPAPLIELFRQLEAAQAALAISKESLDRAEKLFASGELVARKDVQAAQALHAQEQAKLRGLEDRLILEWGALVSKLAPAERTKLLDELLASRQTLIRLSVSRGEVVAGAPLAARLHTPGQELAPLRCTVIVPAPATDPAFQSRAYFGLLDTATAPLAVGLTLTGVLELAGEARAGRFIPQGAVVFYLGKAWVYQKSGDDKFERLAIPTDTPVAGGWFVAGGLPAAPEQIVTQGAQALLSRETLGAAAED